LIPVPVVHNANNTEYTVPVTTLPVIIFILLNYFSARKSSGRQNDRTIDMVGIQLTFIKSKLFEQPLQLGSYSQWIRRSGVNLSQTKKNKNNPIPQRDSF
jgi:hypothetical protein